MINKKETLTFFAVVIILSFVISLLESWNAVWTALSAVAITIGANILAKKILAHRLDYEIEIKLWTITQFGFRPEQKCKRPFPAGIFFPILSKIILFPINNLIWMASLVFDIKPKVYRAAKKHGLYAFSEMTENQMGIIAAAGILTNIVLAIIGYFAGFQTFAQLNIYYAFFNLFPISNLDGNKIFFGNLVLWSFLASVTLLGFIFSILII